MKRLLTAKDIAERYGKSEKTAQRYMRQMVHMEKPLRVTEQAVEAWEIERTYEPMQATETGKTPARCRRSRSAQNPGGRFIIPRVRPARTENVR